MLNLYNSCCKILIDLNCEFDRKKFINNDAQRAIEFRSIETSARYRRNAMSFYYDGDFKFSIGYLLDADYFYIVNNGSMVTDRIDLDKADEIDKISDIEKVLIHGRMITDSVLARSLLFDEETDNGFIEIVNSLKERKT